MHEAWGQDIGKAKTGEIGVSSCEKCRFLGQKEFQTVKIARKINSLATTKPTQKFVWQGKDPSGTLSAVK